MGKFESALKELVRNEVRSAVLDEREIDDRALELAPDLFGKEVASTNELRKAFVSGYVVGFDQSGFPATLEQMMMKADDAYESYLGEYDYLPKALALDAVERQAFLSGLMTGKWYQYNAEQGA